jgi:hypothetical protein
VIKSDVIMGDVIKLRTERKRAKRRSAAETAAANRLLHGRSKSAREIERERVARMNRSLDGLRIETGEKR